MTTETAPALLDGISAELAELEALPTAAGDLPARLPASDILEIELFQSRAALSRYHVESLLAALALDGDLQPLLVLRRGDEAYLIDGWHRKEAYVQANRADSIPVVAFAGSPSAALLEGQRLNRRPSLVTSKNERMDGAWKLVRLDQTRAGRFTTIDIVSATGVSRAHVTFMRKVLRELEDDGQSFARWAAALRAHQKQPERTYTDDDIEAMLDAQAASMADKMVRAIGTKAADNPEVLARVVEIYSGRRIQEVIKELRERNPLDDDSFGEFGDF